MLLHTKHINTLIIDDHPIVIEGYTNVLATINEFSLNISSALNCDEAIEQLKCPTDLVLLDLSLPPSKNEKFISGEDIGLWLRKKSPNTKIIVHTSFATAQRVRDILKNIHPEGFLSKAEIDSTTLLQTVKDVLMGKICHSSYIKEYTCNDNNVNDYTLDEIDRKILYHLCNGETNKTIAELVYLSIRGFEDRKAKLKQVFCITKDSDTNLIKEAKKRGYV